MNNNWYGILLLLKKDFVKSVSIPCGPSNLVFDIDKNPSWIAADLWLKQSLMKNKINSYH